MENLQPNKRSLIPGILTVGNLLCGFLAIKNTLDGNLVSAAWLIILAGVIDGLDGTVARITKSFSNLGAELDSLADVVSFGVAPSVLLYTWYFNEIGILGVAISFLPLLFGAYRLARFNLMLKGFQKENFTGLPIPAQAVTVSTYLIFCETVWGSLRFPVGFAAFVIFLSLLMISNFEYETYPKITKQGSLKNKVKLLFFLLFFILIVLFPQHAFFPVCLVYIIFGFVKGIIDLQQDEDEVPDVSL